MNEYRAPASKRRRRTPIQWIEEFAVPEPNSGCWLWSGTISSSTGYGSVSHKDRHAHRLSYRLYVGEIPAGYHVDHLCRTKACVNPDHLEAVTPAENYRRAPAHVATINSGKTHCPVGHPFDDANTYLAPSTMRRGCRTCLAEQNRRYKATNRDKIREKERIRARDGRRAQKKPLQPLPADDPRHGTLAGYRRCKCDPCKLAKRQEKLTWLAKRKDAREVGAR